MIVYAVFLLVLLSKCNVQGSVRWYTLGDWADPESTFQDRVAAGMNSYAEQFQPEFILTQGDNFYPDGITSLEDPKINSLWREMYNLTNMKDLGWWISLGNHDYGLGQGEEWVQVDLGVADPLWHLPHLWHDFIRSDGEVTVHFIVIDTQALEQKLNNYAVMMQWLEERLNTTTSDWVIVTGHHPIYSCGLVGPVAGTFYGELLPVLDKYSNKLDMFLAGHDHNVQLLQTIGNPGYFDFVINGGGGSALFGEEPGYADTLRDQYGIEKTFMAAIGSFVAMEATSESLTMTFVDQDANVLHTYSRVKSAV